MTKKRPIAIDLFSGAGGLSLGLEQAGFDIVCAVEIDPIHACTHEYNFPDCKVLADSIENVKGTDIRTTCNIDSSTQIDLVAGGAPCQGFSLMGQRALDDPRNLLVKEFIRIVDELKPTYFLFENVKGITIGHHKKFLTEVIDGFHKIGYQVLIPWQVLNAKNYGVPQNRERLFLMGTKAGSKLPNYPKPHKKIVTCKEALDDLPDAEEFDKLLVTDEVEFKYTKRASGYSASMRCSNEASWHLGYKRKWDKSKLTSSLRSDHTTISRRRFAETKPGEVEPVSRFFRLPEDGVSNTLRAGTDSARGAFTSPRPIHYKYARCVTVREMARLHGFPDWFRFHETKWHGARQIGNAVPPPLARAIGTEILKALGTTVKMPTKTLNLGEVDLLRVNMKGACNYWEVANPIGKRDRKNGQKKRKQEEIENSLLEVVN